MSLRDDGKSPAPEPEWENLLRSEERHRLARELHDTTAQTLAVMQLQLGRLRRSGAGNAEPLIEELQGTIRQIRESIRGLDLD